MKILVVHRQKEVVDQVRQALSSTEPYIRFFTSGLDGLLQAKIQEFDLIVCGTDLPVITGIELVRSLRNSSVNTTTTVVFLADEPDNRAEHLSRTLKVAGTLATRDMPKQLPVLVDEYFRTDRTVH
ncbi:MAG: response regulator [Cyclobacteriaceae bacterium]|nr:response regulator [Cyclobacteriaceae bacterium]